MVREPEWDDVEREKMFDLAEYEEKVCKCGFHESIADQDPDLEMDLRVCPICAGVAKGVRILDAEDDKQVKALGRDPAPDASLPDDGRHIRLRFKPPTGRAEVQPPQ